MDDEELLAIMGKRKKPEMRSHLTQRIIDNAHLCNKRNESFIIKILRDFQRNLILPHPAYALVTLVFLGMALGYGLDLSSFDFVSVEEGFEDYAYFASEVQEEDWL